MMQAEHLRKVHYRQNQVEGRNTDFREWDWIVVTCSLVTFGWRWKFTHALQEQNVPS